MGVLIYDPRPIDSLDELEDELARAFRLMRGALSDGDAVIVILDERDLQGSGAVASSALASGLLGMVRALAIEGREPGWRVAALSTAADVGHVERRRWIEHLSETDAARGALVRLGGDHLGKVPV
jgi:hypothetical protein